MQQQLNDFTIRFFRYFDKKFHGLDGRFQQQDTHIEGLYRLIDRYTKLAERQEQEAVLEGARVARLEALANTMTSQSNRLPKS